MKKILKVPGNWTFRVVILSIVAVMATYTFLPDYLQKAVIYLTPDIDDYQIFNNRKVETGDSIPWPKAKQYNQVRIPETVRDSLEKYQSVAFLVIHQDSLLYEEYWDSHDSTTISNSFSMAKSFVSLLVGCAIKDGFINGIDDKVIDYFPELKGAYREELTLRHLLTMSSSSSWNESYTSPFSITTQAYYGRNLDKIIKKIKIKNNPGIEFEYRSGDTQILAKVLTVATGKTLSQYASEKLWQPLGAEMPALWSLDKREGMEKAFCCFNSTARDFAKIGNLVANEGSFRGKQLVPESYIEQMTAPVKYLSDEDAEMVNYYGLSWWIMKPRNTEIPYARGILGQYIYVLPESEAVIVRLGHKRSLTYRDNHPIDAYTWLEAGQKIIEQNQ
ncbi:MAG: serine hydrolase domain-containing protein [Marinilabiliaceae bacterium]